MRRALAKPCGCTVHMSEDPEGMGDGGMALRVEVFFMACLDHKHRVYPKDQCKCDGCILAKRMAAVGKEQFARDLRKAFDELGV